EDKSAQISKVAADVSKSANTTPTTNVNFSPVYHVQGNVSDEQINKLEKMTLKVAKQVEKIKPTGRNVGFAD
ncbi:MAG TPA: hypothetical protein DCS35_07130, partial [Vibrio sp.]|nr:hypothetical protein [Vibrio sp.]